MKVSRHEKPNMAVAGAKIERRKRPTRAILGATGMVEGKDGIEDSGVGV